MVEEHIDMIKVDEDFSSRLPKLSPDKFRALKEDISDRGIRNSLLISRDGILLDGHNRIKAARELGITMVPVRLLNTHGASWEDCILDHVHRRHLTSAQLATLATSLERIERDRAKKRQGRRSDLEDSGSEDEQVDKVRKKDRATDRVAKAVGISRNTYERTKIILEKGDEETRDKLMSGDISIALAYEKTKEHLSGIELSDEDRDINSAKSDLRSWIRRYRNIKKLERAKEMVSMAIEAITNQAAS